MSRKITYSEMMMTEIKVSTEDRRQHHTFCPQSELSWCVVHVH
jgi:hypothetical protein